MSEPVRTSKTRSFYGWGYVEDAPTPEERDVTDAVWGALSGSKPGKRVAVPMAGEFALDALLHVGIPRNARRRPRELSGHVARDQGGDERDLRPPRWHRHPPPRRRPRPPKRLRTADTGASSRSPARRQSAARPAGHTQPGRFDRHRGVGAPAGSTPLLIEFSFDDRKSLLSYKPRWSKFF